MNYLSVFDHIVGLPLKRLRELIHVSSIKFSDIFRGSGSELILLNLTTNPLKRGTCSSACGHPSFGICENTTAS